MGKRVLLLGLIVALLAAVPAVAVASGLKPFSATGDLEQTVPGTLSATTAPPGVPLPPGIPGTLNAGQEFSGKFDSSTWGALKKASVNVIQNSFIAADVGLLFGAPVGASVPLGLDPGEVPAFAFGSFAINKGANAVAGTYGAVIEGSLTRVAPETCPSLIFVDVTDVGSWSVVPGSAQGAYQQINEVGGILFALAGGCLGEESATLTIDGLRGKAAAGSADDAGNDDDGEDDDEEKGKKDKEGKGEKDEDD